MRSDSTASQRYLVVVSPIKTQQSVPDGQALHLRRSAPAIRAAATLLSSTFDQHRTLAHRKVIVRTSISSIARTTCTWYTCILFKIFH